MGTQAKAKRSLSSALEDDHDPFSAIPQAAEFVASLTHHIKEKITEATNKLDQNISAHIRSIQNQNAQLTKNKTATERTEKVGRQQGTINYLRSKYATFNDRIKLDEG